MNFATGSRIRNLLHQTFSLLTDKDRRTNCWIRRKQNMIRNNPDKSEFSNLLHCVLCTRLLILKAHVPSKVNLRARWHEIYCKMYLRTKRSRIAVVVYLALYLGWPNRPSVVFFQGPLGKSDNHVGNSVNYQVSPKRVRTMNPRKNKSYIR